MTNLSDTQRILLSSAAQRATGSLIPLPASLKPGGGTSKAITALIKRGFAAERETPDQTAGCCQSNANRSPRDARQPLSASA